MYDKRIKIFTIATAAALLVCLLRLMQLQLAESSSYREKIAELKAQRGHSRPLKTVRGRILDRKGRILAADEPRFYLHIGYGLSSTLDERVWKVKLLKAAKRQNADIAAEQVKKEQQAKLEILQQVIDKCTHFGTDRTVVENKIKKINDNIWNMRTYLA